MTTSDDIDIIDGSNADGDCSSVAVAVAEELRGAGALVVHGYPVSRRPEHRGLMRRYFHAWVEIGDIVIDKSNGLDVTMRREHYYALGLIQEESVSRYTLQDAALNMIEFRHYGPWDGSEPPLPEDDA